VRTKFERDGGGWGRSRTLKRARPTTVWVWSGVAIDKR
jgi:hypothetical protein